MVKHKNGTVEYVGSTCYIQTETLQVMSDIWEQCEVAYSIDDDGSFRPTYLWRDVDGKCSHEVEIDVTEAALMRLRDREYTIYHNRFYDDALNECQRPDVRGRTVAVTRGRKHKGKTGTVVVVMEAPYRAGYRTSIRHKLGVALSDRKVTVMRAGREFENYADMVWVWAHNCSVVNPKVPQPADFEQQANEAADTAVRKLRNRIAHQPSKRAA